MSAGKFNTDAKYQADGGSIHPIRVQPETVLASFDATVNSVPAAAVDSDFAAKVSRGNRGYGLKPRSVTIRWTGVVPDGYDPDGTVTFPVLQPAAYNAINKSTVITYNGGTGKMVYKSPERLS